jgi:DNA-binding LytR/AlgR family response regulator
MSKRSLRTLIVDDEPVARSVLAEELAEMAETIVVGEAENGEEALRRIEELRPDLVLLDIQMPVMDGFEVIRRLRGPLPAIVFVTAFSDHALRAFEIGAVDYLLKPISVERLRTAIGRVRQARTKRVESAERVARTLDAADSRRRPRVVARQGRDLYLLDLDEVFAFQAEGDIVWIVGANKKFTATQSLQEIYKKLQGAEFQRVHRGAIVNTNKIRKISALSSQRWLLTLTNGLQFTVSKRQAPMLRDILR